jgi:bifunctional non-homologous end joining protein LigD
VHVSQTFSGSGAELLEAARGQGLEGIVAKRASSKYVGTRSDDWRKVKVANEDDFLICGYTEDKRDYFASLVLGERDSEGNLSYMGNVGTGFDNATIKEIHRQMEPLRQEKSPFAKAPKFPQKVNWVRPELTCAVRYLERTTAGRLRAPVFAGLRDAPTIKKLLPAGKSAIVSVDGHNLNFTNLDKVMFPRDGITKRDLIEYYDAVSEWLLPHLKDRPLSLLRFPDGIESERFFQKHVDGKFPPWFRTLAVPSGEGKTREWPVGNEKAELLYLANLGCIDQNPWMSRVQSLDNPDFVLIDLDSHESGYGKIIEAALHVHKFLEELGLKSFPKTTGGDGMHVYIPIAPKYSYDEAKSFAEMLARRLAEMYPNTFTTPRSVSARTKDRVYFDWVQIGRGKTISAPYVVRPKAGAPVATPLEWSEVTRDLNPKQFHIRNAIDRFRAKGDLFAGVLKTTQSLDRARKQLEKRSAQA